MNSSQFYVGQKDYFFFDFKMLSDDSQVFLATVQYLRRMVYTDF